MDLRALEVGRVQAKRMCDEGTLVRVAPGVYAAGGRELDQHGRILVACREVGGVASHRTAAWLHGLHGPWRVDQPEITRLGPKADYRTSASLVHTTTWLPDDDLVEVDGVPCLSVARTLFSLAALVPASLHRDTVRAAVDDAVRLGKASDRWLWWRLEKSRCRGRNGVRVFESILVERSGGAMTESWLERELLRVLGEAGLPPPVCQGRIRARGAFLARVDFLYPSSRVVIEACGAVAHSSPAQRAADSARRNRLLTAGYLVLEFTYEQVVREPTLVVAQVRDALAATGVEVDAA